MQAAYFCDGSLKSGLVKTKTRNGNMPNINHFLATPYIFAQNKLMV